MNADIRGVKPDFRVDRSKLIWSTGLGEFHPPIQCTAVRHPITDPRTWWQRLTGYPRRSHDGERCQLYLGHWEHESQREHYNAYGERWPVNAADTAPYNP